MAGCTKSHRQKAGDQDVCSYLETQNLHSYSKEKSEGDA